MEKEVMQKTGYLTGDVKFSEFQDTGKKLSTFQIGVNTGKGEDKQTEWVSVRAWDDLAEKIKDLKKGVKVSVKGSWEKYTQKSTNTEKDVFQISELNEHKKLEEKVLTVGNVDFKKPKNVELVEIALYDNSPEGKDSRYKMTGFQEKVEKIKELDLKPGDKVKISGDVEVIKYLDKDKEPKTALEGNIFNIDLLERAKDKNTNNETSKENENKEEKSTPEGSEKSEDKKPKKNTSKKVAADKEM